MTSSTRGLIAVPAICAKESALKKVVKMSRFIVVLAALLSLTTLMTGCEAAKEIINEEEVQLKEADLPNCSKILACCNYLRTDALASGLVPDEVKSACADQFEPAADAVITNYQETRAELRQNLNDGGQTVDDLRTTTQDTVEPGCRCFIEGTIGKISGDFIDACAPDTSTGQAGSEACTEAEGDLFDAADETNK